MLAPLLLLWPMSVVLTWLVAQGIANKPFDRELGEMVRVLAKEVAVDAEGAGGSGRAQATFRLPAAAAEILHTDDSDDIYYQVLGAQGEYLSGDAALPVPRDEDRAPPGEVRFRDETLNGDSVRVAYLWISLPERVPGRANAPAAEAPLVQVAETLGKRSRLATEIIKGVIQPQFVILPLAVLLVWLALARGIAPLGELQQRIRKRDANDLSPIDEREAPEEVSPLVRAINDLLARLDLSLRSQKHFLADAAHQLKTPLAGLRTQAELAQRQPVNVARLATETVRDFVPRALEKRIDLGYEGPADSGPRRAPQVLGHALLLREMIRNLVDNALQYTPAGGTATVRVLEDPFGQVVVLQVEDSGPGIAPAERELVFQPFYRSLGTEVDGSGLGLAIVREIALQHGAEITVAESGQRGAAPGTLITVRLPASPAAAPEADPLRLSSESAAGSSRSTSGSPGPARA
ncbi:MAG: sensor histidine kinase N-terminal domain-containing protein [Caldimonas sp.]